MIIADVEVYSSFAMAKRHDVQLFDGGRKMYGARSVGIHEPENNLLPIGACGLKVQFHFLDPAWENLSKTAVFRNGNASVDAAIIDNCATVPHEVLTKVMDVVYVGVYGTDSGRNIAIPTIWTQLGTVTGAANPSGQSSAEPTLPYWAQIKEQLDTCQDEMMDQEDLENALIQAKESGAFDGPRGEKGDKGDKGDTGAAGYSPVKGVDYWTTEDQVSVITEAANTVSKVLQSSYDIVTEEYGSTIILTDASQREPYALNLYGKTTQNGTPTPDAPAELENVGNSGSISVKIGTSETDENPQTLTATTPNGLPGIPVSSGGNYTDENGQQWICDEIDFARGVYVKRCITIEIDSSREIYEVSALGANTRVSVLLHEDEKINSNTVGLYSHGAYRNSSSTDNPHGYVYTFRALVFLPLESATEEAARAYFEAQHRNGTPVTITYVAEHEQEIALTGEEIAAYAALHTNKPNTTIFNDAGAGMRVAYVADAKLYIDKKFAGLASAIINNV